MTTGAIDPMLSDEDPRASVTDRLRALIRDRLANQLPLSLPTLARALAMSPRTLQRKLRAEGTHFGEILHAERMAASRALLHAGCRRDAVARAIGYKSTRSVDRIRSRERSTLHGSAEQPSRELRDQCARAPLGPQDCQVGSSLLT